MAEKLLVTQFTGLGMEHLLGKVTRVTAGSLLAQNEEILRIVAKDAEVKYPLVNAPYVMNGKPHRRPGARGAAKLKLENEVYATETKVLRDPSSKRILNWKPGQPRAGRVDMGHKPGREYWRIFRRYVCGEITLDEFKKIESTADNFQIQGIPENRGHKNENKDGK